MRELHSLQNYLQNKPTKRLDVKFRNGFQSHLVFQLRLKTALTNETEILQKKVIID